jgi:hypothetical protein
MDKEIKTDKINYKGHKINVYTYDSGYNNEFTYGFDIDNWNDSNSGYNKIDHCIADAKREIDDLIKNELEAIDERRR